MINHHFSLICKHASIDEYSKSVSIFDVIEQINVLAKPDQTVNIPMHFDVFSLWMRSDLDTPAKGVARVFLRDPNGISKKHVEVDIELSESTYFRSIIKVSAIELRGPGKYNFIIELKQKDENWKEMASIPFIVTYKSPKEDEKVLKSKNE